MTREIEEPILPMAEGGLHTLQLTLTQNVVDWIEDSLDVPDKGEFALVLIVPATSI